MRALDFGRDGKMAREKTKREREKVNIEIERVTYRGKRRHGRCEQLE